MNRSDTSEQLSSVFGKISISELGKNPQVDREIILKQEELLKEMERKNKEMERLNKEKDEIIKNMTVKCSQDALDEELMNRDGDDVMGQSKETGNKIQYQGENIQSKFSGYVGSSNFGKGYQGQYFADGNQGQQGQEYQSHEKQYKERSDETRYREKEDPAVSMIHI